ncbi:hypothetical protein [Syntrophorhabdus aromaticivorans]|jgi:hypothetical protein|uniref:Uncharacterized protein n=1 Tax=Syntrophorhabdus aromaticivorans TaxID=328301 RepID=A0A351U6M3_9BACT|nr:hypothetical protein [Syntrophorhabdus aromaticivorans]NLW36137.1 hypothetical protein [Syntrophorhabdus aromaticivorans]HBA55604.1 hypothetical protein [Syntrophorhabdus aromaticivorans]
MTHYDIDGLNEMPVNRKAEKMLISVGNDPDPSSLYSVQLALWGLDVGQLTMETSVCEFTRAMVAWRPERLMNFLMFDEGAAAYDPPGWETAETPMELALAVLDDIERKMIIHFPWCAGAE